MRVGRFLKRALPVAAAAALTLGTATALAGSGVGAVFNLGQTNSVNGTSTLAGTSSGAQLRVTNASTATGTFSLHALMSSTTPGAGSAAVRGYNSGTGSAGYGVWGSQAGSGTGVYGTAATGGGIGVYGANTGATGAGAGVRGQTASPAGAGVLGVNTGGGPGLKSVVNAGVAPLTVNSSTKVANLNADKLDGVDSSGFLAVGGKAQDSNQLDGNDSSYFLPATGTAADADKLDGVDSTEFGAAPQSESISQSNTLITNASCADINGPEVTATVGSSGLIAVYAEASIFTPAGTFSLGVYDGTSCTQLLSVTNGNGFLKTLPGSATGTTAPNPSWVIVHTTPGTHTFSLRATGSGGYGDRSLFVLPL